MNSMQLIHHLRGIRHERLALSHKGANRRVADLRGQVIQIFDALTRLALRDSDNWPALPAIRHREAAALPIAGT